MIFTSTIHAYLSEESRSVRLSRSCTTMPSQRSWIRTLTSHPTASCCFEISHLGRSTVGIPSSLSTTCMISLRRSFATHPAPTLKLCESSSRTTQIIISGSVTTCDLTSTSFTKTCSARDKVSSDCMRSIWHSEARCAMSYRRTRRWHTSPHTSPPHKICFHNGCPIPKAQIVTSYARVFSLSCS